MSDTVHVVTINHPRARAVATCLTCRRLVGVRHNRITGESCGLMAHYNPDNPPVYGAWESCPGPTDAQRRRAAADFPDHTTTIQTPGPWPIVGALT